MKRCTSSWYSTNNMNLNLDVFFTHFYEAHQIFDEINVYLVKLFQDEIIQLKNDDTFSQVISLVICHWYTLTIITIQNKLNIILEDPSLKSDIFVEFREFNGSLDKFISILNEQKMFDKIIQNSNNQILRSFFESVIYFKIEYKKFIGDLKNIFDISIESEKPFTHSIIYNLAKLESGISFN